MQQAAVCCTKTFRIPFSIIFQEGGFVPECIRRPEIGLDLEIFNTQAAADIQERMATFNELHFYDGTLSTNLTLEEAHLKIGLMLKVSISHKAGLYR